MNAEEKVTIGESKTDAVVVDPPNVGGWGRVRIPTGYIIVANKGMMQHKQALQGMRTGGGE